MEVLEQAEESNANIDSLGSISHRWLKPSAFKALRVLFSTFNDQSHISNRIALASPLSTSVTIDPSTQSPTSSSQPTLSQPRPTSSTPAGPSAHFLQGTDREWRWRRFPGSSLHTPSYPDSRNLTPQAQTAGPFPLRYGCSQKVESQQWHRGADSIPFFGDRCEGRRRVWDRILRRGWWL